MLNRVLFTLSSLLIGIASSEPAAPLSPISLVADPHNQRLYIAETTSHGVAVFDMATEKVIGTLSVADHPVGLALSARGRRLFVTSAVPKGIVQVIDLGRMKVVDRIGVGHTPVAVTMSPDGKTLYVCNQFTNNVSVIDLDRGEQVAVIPVAREPVAAVLTPDGQTLFVANHLPIGAANGEHTACVVSIIETSSRRVIKTLDLPDGSVNLRAMAMSPEGHYVYITHTLSRYQYPVAYLERGWINTNAMTILDVPNQTYFNTILLDDPHAGAADPYGIACTSDGKSIVVTHAGSHELSVIDRQAMHYHIDPARSARRFRSSSGSQPDMILLETLTPVHNLPNNVSFLSGLRRRFKLKGNGPRGVIVVGSTVYAAEYFTDSLGILNLGQRRQAKPRSIRLGPAVSQTQVRRGEQLFHDASRSFETWHSCATCHTGGARSTALNWDLLNDGVSNAKNTKSLLLTHETPPVMSTGVRPNADSAIRSGIFYVQFAYPSPAVVSPISAYLKSLTPVPSPYLVQGALSESARQGETLFRTIGCVQCHSGPHYTDMKKHDVGTSSDMDSGAAFDVPTLIELWRTSPYLHDGRAATIKDVLTTFNVNDQHARTSHLSEDELSYLVDYVRTR